MDELPRPCLSTSQRRILKFISIKIYSIINIQRWKLKQLWQKIIKRSWSRSEFLFHACWTVENKIRTPCSTLTSNFIRALSMLSGMFLPWNRIFTKSRGCRSRVDAAPPLTPATRCSHFKWRNIPLTGGVTLASFTCDLLMVRLSGVWLSLYMNILNNTWNVSKICKTYTTLKVKERRILLHFHTSLSYVYSITTRSHFDVTSQAIRVIFLSVM